MSGWPAGAPDLVNVYHGSEGWMVSGSAARHRCRDCGCETDRGTLFCETGPFGSDESVPVCPRSGCGSRNVDLIVSYGT